VAVIENFKSKTKELQCEFER
jgi:hypothetical protein